MPSSSSVRIPSAGGCDASTTTATWCTNNEAEYGGLIAGLRCALSLGVRYIVVQGDSQLILRQLDGSYRVKSRTLLTHYNEAMSLVREFESFEACHIERSRNSRADELANLAMDSRTSMGFTK
ncbi:hypothetical protein ACHAXA_008168 [Cyclostephanos tholiformis]|uniref:RNase H type-1 domain-containing protein n=1 Tax=Cyclostephanos tholiformis TaxID=382380 RepID=A0ABD3RCY2_9STRA